MNKPNTTKLVLLFKIYILTNVNFSIGMMVKWGSNPAN